MDHSAAEKGRHTLRRNGSPVGFRCGDRLIVAGANSDDVMLLEAGLVKVVLGDTDGAETMVGLFGRGEVLGEMGVIWQRPRSANVIALTDGAVVRVSGSVFLRLRQRDRDVRDLLDTIWRRRQQDADDRQLAQVRDVATRVAMTLLKWAQCFGRPTEDGLLMRGVTQRDLAQAVCASEKTVEAVLRELRTARLVLTGRRSYRIPFPDVLEGRINGSG